MNTESSLPPAIAEELAAIPVKRERCDFGELIATFLWQLFVIAVGIFVGSIVAVVAGLYFGWLDITC